MGCTCVSLLQMFDVRAACKCCVCTPQARNGDCAGSICKCTIGILGQQILRNVFGNMLPLC